MHTYLVAIVPEMAVELMLNDTLQVMGKRYLADVLETYVLDEEQQRDISVANVSLQNGDSCGWPQICRR